MQDLFLFKIKMFSWIPNGDVRIRVKVLNPKNCDYIIETFAQLNCQTCIGLKFGDYNQADNSCIDWNVRCTYAALINPAWN
jgi:hypothetical protein